MDEIIVLIATVICIAQLIVCLFVESKIPIKLKENDTLQRIRKRKNNYLTIILVVGIFIFILAYYGVKNQILIFGMIFGIFLVFMLTGANTIFARIEKKEKLFFAEHIISILKGSSIKNIILKDEQLRKSVIMDSIQDIELQINLKTGKDYSIVKNVEQLISLDAVGKQSQEELLQSNFVGIEVEELEKNEINLKVKTKTGKTFQKVIEKWELPQYIEVK